MGSAYDLDIVSDAVALEAPPNATKAAMRGVFHRHGDYDPNDG